MGKGSLTVGVKDDRGLVLTKDYGFTVQEESKVLGFDLFDHPELGTLILFGDQILALKFWTNEDLEKGRQLLETGISRELERRSRATE